MKLFIKRITSLCLITCIVIAGSIGFDKQVFAADIAKAITVIGNSSVTFEPNIAYVNVGVITQNREALTAQSENNNIINGLISKLRAEGISEKDINTSYFYVNPIYDFESGTQNITGYMVNNSITVTVRNLNNIGRILDLALENGANSVNNVSFSNTDSDKYYLQALEAAIADGNKKADVLANSAGYKIGKIVNIKEESYFNGFNYFSNDVAMQKQSSSVNVIVPGELSINASVIITYDY